MIKKENYIGFVFLTLLLLSSYIFLESSTLFIRFLIGLSFGFVLVRASLGFAGSINKLYRAKSSYVVKMLMYIFILTSIFTAFIISGDERSYSLALHPINFGIIFGGLMFGFGMAMSSCCATGSLADLASGFSRAFVTIIFFGLGVFLGFHTQGTSSFVKDSFFTSELGESFQGGVFLPDLFKFDGFNGYLGAIVLTSIFAFIAIFLAKRYEDSFESETDNKSTDSTTTIFEKIFIEPWKMYASVVGISAIFAFLLLFSQKGWSASSALGVWFGKFIMLFGVEAKTLEELTTKSYTLFENSVFTNYTSVQNFGIILGSATALMIAGTFNKKFIAGLKITPKGVATFAFGGFIMGLGTRFSNGCNVGALFTPIAEFSLSGWIYLVFVAVGGFAGNMFVKKFISKTCNVI